MITAEPTSDLDLVRSIITHPRIWPSVSDDFSGSPEEYQPVDHPSVTYLLMRDGNEVLGLFMLVMQSRIVVEVHTCLLPNAWGSRAAEAARTGQRWVWDHTTARRLITSVPTYNRLALRFAQRSGMVEYGRHPHSFQKDNELHDVILLGTSREGN